MPIDIPESSISDKWGPCRVPAPLEKASMASDSPLRITIERAIARTRELRDILLKENGNTGITRRRSVSSISLVRGIVTADRQHGDTAIVITPIAGGAWREYVYQSASTQADDGTHVLKPSDLDASAPGRWIDTTRTMFGTSGALLAPEGLLVQGSNAVVNESLSVGGSVQAGSSISAAGDMSCQGGHTVQGALLVNGPTTLHGPTTTIDGTCQINNFTRHNGDVETLGTTTLKGPLVCAAGGLLCVKVIKATSSSTLHVYATDGNLVRIPAGTTIGVVVHSAGAVEGAIMEFVTEDTSNIVGVANESFASLASLKAHSGFPFSCRIYFHESQWRLLSLSPSP